MKKRQFKQKLNFTKVTVFDLSKARGGRAAGTHYDFCDPNYTEFPCQDTIKGEF